jgi:CubicO group peptidase (beta-lactamase class C family)
MTLIVAVLAQAALAAPDAAALDAYVRAAMERQRMPGFALAVVGDGAVVHARGYGLANVELQVPVTPETVFQSGSVGKMFAAALALLLADEGKLGLDDPVSRYVPAPRHWKGVTVRHLLTHTSGIKEYTDTVDLRRDYTEAELVEMAGQPPLDFAPGTRWSYSNTAYAVLGAVLRKAGGAFYGHQLRERIFVPLGMRTARVISEEDIVPNRADGYRLDKGGALKNQEWVAPTLNTTADGALYLTTNDLAKWALALDTDVPLPARLREQMWTPARLADGRVAEARESGYGLGWFVKKVEGQPLLDHGGAWQGFQAYIGRFPEQRLSVVAFANLGGSDPGAIARAVAGHFRPALRRGE